MMYSGFLASAALMAVANAHSTIYNIWINDVDQGLGNVAGGYIRYPPNNNPVKDITSTDMTCNVANTANTKTLAVAAGDKITLEWHHDSNSASDDIIASSHKGPVMAYMAPTASGGSGDVWVKVAEDGYDGSTWAVDTLITNKGKYDFTIPSTLAAGDYLIRGEIIALHEADAAYNVNSARGAQFYMECVQVTVSGSGATALPAGVAIPGAYAYTDPGVVFNLYGSFTSYTIPGPAIWDGASSGTTTSPPAAVVASSTAVVKASSTSAAVVISSTQAAVATSSEVLFTTSAESVTIATTLTAIESVTTSSAAVSSAAPVQASAITSAAVSSASKSACVVKSSKTTLATVASPAASSDVSTVAKYAQCGGTGYTGSTSCASGSTCTVQNPYYSQCI